MPTNHIITNPDAAANLIIVMGVSGSGKSTIARALANHFDYLFLEGDDFHSQAARDHMAQGQPLSDAMRLPWVTHIRDRLRTAAHNNQDCVLAFSGLKKAHRDILRTAPLRTIVLHLHGDKNVIEERVNKRSNHFMPSSLLDSQFESLEDTRHEQDVIGIDIVLSPEQVTRQAIHTVNKTLAPQNVNVHS